MSNKITFPAKYNLFIYNSNVCESMRSFLVV